MEPTLPPLDSLRTFEAAARHLSFTRAAEELHVTQSAVSHRIKALEGHLGVPLFRRLNRTLLLTDAGQAYQSAVRRALDDLTRATRALVDLETSGVLTISVLPSFAAKWLVPRMESFQARHPDIALRIAASEALADFTRDGVDVAIRLGLGSWPGLAIDPLREEWVTPVCAPALTEGEGGVRTPSDLQRHTLLHDDHTLAREHMGLAEASYAGWRDWLEAAGVEDIDASRGPRFSHTYMALQAAIDGRGVALGQGLLAADDLMHGRLVEPFDLRLPAGFGYYLVCPEAAATRPKVVAFRDWLRAEIGAEDVAKLGNPG